MSSGTKKTPPKFLEGMSYSEWKRKLDMWKIVTKVEKKEQAIIVRLDSFEGYPKAEKAVSELTAAELNVDDGMKVLVGKLDSVFKSEKIDESYDAYAKFISFQKSEDMSMTDYILEFEHLNRKMSEHDMKLPDAVLTFKLLDGAKLKEDERKLALAMGSDLKLDAMKSSLKRVFKPACSTEFNKGTTEIKQEEAFFLNKRNSNKYFPKPGMPSSKNQGGKLNPINKHGQVSRCVICDSKMHWATQCPHNQKKQSVYLSETEEVVGNNGDCEEVNITLITEEVDKNEIFVVETSRSAVVDTACTKTVAGVQWYEKYYNNLSPFDQDKVKLQPSNTAFKFGDGRKVEALKKVTFPAVIAGTNCKIETELVHENIPLLLSKQSLKKAGTIIDMKNDKAIMFNKEIGLHTSTSGHYCVDICPQDEPAHTEEMLHEVLYLEGNLSPEQKKAQIIKLHKQFGHAASNKLKKLVSNAGLLTSDINIIIEDAVNKCETCFKYKKPAPRPVVAFSKASDFNETVSMDLHELQPNVWYIHFIDEFTRYSNASIIRSKNVAVRCFLRHWISLFGAPHRVFSDNGGEFIGEEMYELCHSFGIKMVTTPSYSPWSNGLCERHNQTLTNILLKIKDDTKCDWETALAWAISAKNSLINNNGFSPAQLVLGRNGNFPNTINDKLPALESLPKSSHIGLHISALHAARRSFLQSESCEKIKRALKKQTRPSGQVYIIGDEVYYKRDDSHEWKGPAKVLGQDGPVVFLRQGTRRIKAHLCRVQSVDQPHSKIGKLDEVSDRTSTDKDLSINKEPVIVVNNQSSTCDEEEGSDVEDKELDVQQDNKAEIFNLVLKPEQRISFTAEDGNSCEAVVISSAGKKTGKYKNWYNVEYSHPEHLSCTQGSVDLGAVKDLQTIDDQIIENGVSTNKEKRVNCEVDEILETKHLSFEMEKMQELESWKQNDVYEEVPYNNQKCISVRWICSTKETENGVKLKARLVARGFEEDNVQELQKESPTCAKDTLRVMSSVIIQNKWELKSIDIKTAFLQGEAIQRKVFLRPPPEARCKESYVWELKKPVYGLSDASLKWYNRVLTFISSSGGKVSMLDPALFLWHKENKLTGIIALHVDDFLWSGDHDFEKNVISKLRQTFVVGKEESRSFRYLGLNVEHHDDQIFIHQYDYIEALKPLIIKAERLKDQDQLLSKEEKEMVRSKIGQLLWISTQTCPNISMEASSLAINLKNGTVKDMIQINKIIMRAKDRPSRLRFQPLSVPKVVVYTDASFGNLADGGSQGGYLIFLVGEDGSCNLLSWQSKRIRRVVRSTLASEAMAMLDGLDGAVFISSLYSEILYGKFDVEVPMEVITDNKSLVDALGSSKPVDDKRLRIDISALKEAFKQNMIKCQWVPTALQLADCLTKKGASSLKLMETIETGRLPTY